MSMAQQLQIKEAHDVMQTVSVVHECGQYCELVNSKLKIEREEVNTNKYLTLSHN